MKFRIDIPSPCNADWNKMSLNSLGKHCSLCDKTVVDFSNWTSEQITEYLQVHRAEKTCGRFKKQQLNVSLNKDDITTSLIQWKAPYIQKIAAVVAICFALNLQSCSTSLPEGRAPQAQNIDTTAGDEVIILGEIAPPPIEDTITDLAPPPPKLAQPNPPISYEPIDDPVMGDIVYIEEPQETVMGAPVIEEEIPPSSEPTE